MQNMTAELIKNYGAANEQEIFNELISFMFLDSKSRSKLTVVCDCILSILEWNQKVEAKKLKTDVLLHLLDKKL